MSSASRPHCAMSWIVRMGRTTPSCMAIRGVLRSRCVGSMRLEPYAVEKGQSVVHVGEVLDVLADHHVGVPPLQVKGGHFGVEDLLGVFDVLHSFGRIERLALIF